jgi:hypothetical protein
MSNNVFAPLEHAAARAIVNRENAQHSTGPRTDSGKQRSSQNALKHGLTAASAILPSEDPAAYEDHRRGFLDEYKPATLTESQLVQELIDTSWRLNRIPALEAYALTRAFNLPPDFHIDPATEFDILEDAHRALAILSIHSGRLSRQFQKALTQLRSIQEERAQREQRDLKAAAEILIRHQRKGLAWNPADDGFVFSKQQIERHAQFLIHQNPAYFDPDRCSQAPLASADATL